MTDLKLKIFQADTPEKLEKDVNWFLERHVRGYLNSGVIDGNKFFLVYMPKETESKITWPDYDKTAGGP